MDATHIVLGGMLLSSVVVAIIGFLMLGRMLKKDEAIDAAIFLAHRQLEEYLRHQPRQ